MGRILIFLPIFFPFQIKAEKIDTLRSVYIKKIELSINAEEDILSFQNKNLLYLSSDEIIKGQKLVWLINLNNHNSLMKIKLEEPITSKYTVTAIGGSEKKILFICHDSIYFYKIEGNKAKIILTKANFNSFLEVDFSENSKTIILHKLYNFHPNDQKVCCQYLYLNEDNFQEIVNDTIIYEAIVYSHQIHKWQNFNASNDFSLLALTTKNKIIKINRFHQYDTIYLPLEKKVLVPDSFLNLPQRGKPLVKNLISNDMFYNRIEKIFENKDTVLISEIFPGSGKDYRLLTYCFKNEGVWRFKEYVYKNSNDNSGKSLNLSYSSPTYLFNNQMLSISQDIRRDIWHKNKFIYSLFFYELK
jgi:hypothetical protein